MIDIREHGGIYADGGGGGGGGMVTNKEEPLVIKNPELFVDNSDVNALQKNVSEIANGRMIIYSTNITNDIEVIKSGYGLSEGKFNEDFTNYCDEGGAYIVTSSGFKKIGLPGVTDGNGVIKAISQKSEIILGKPNQSKEHARLWYETTSGFSEYTVNLEGKFPNNGLSIDDAYFLNFENDKNNYFYIARNHLLHVALEHTDKIATIKILTTHKENLPTEYLQFAVPYDKKNILCLRHSSTNLPENKWSKSLVIDVYNLEGKTVKNDLLFSNIGPGTTTTFGSALDDLKCNVGDGVSKKGTVYLKKENLLQIGFSTTSSSSGPRGFSGLFKYDTSRYQFNLIESYRDHHNVIGITGAERLKNMIPSDFPSTPTKTLKGLTRNMGGYGFETPTHTHEMMYSNSSFLDLTVSGRHAYITARIDDYDGDRVFTIHTSQVASPYNKVPFYFYSEAYKVGGVNLKEIQGFLIPKGPLKEFVLVFHPSSYNEGFLGLIPKHKLKYKWIIGDKSMTTLYDSLYPINSCLFKVERDSRGKITRMEKI